MFGLSLMKSVIMFAHSLLLFCCCRSFNDSSNASFGSFHLPSSEAQAFSQEMLDWYADHDGRPAPPPQPGQQHGVHAPPPPQHENSTLV